MLRKVAQDIPVDYPNLKELIQNMFETNTASDGVGLAAPQIGKSIRVVVIDLDVLLDEELQEHDEWVEGYLARVMQHEFDHLEGKMFVDRVSPLRKSLIMNKLRAMAKGKYSCRYRTKAAHK